VILAVTLISGAAVMVINVFVDVVYALVDPRVSLGATSS
jgi:ABC-type dipeptide/oligopeptide/nickel transport system permease component